MAGRVERRSRDYFATDSRTTSSTASLAARCESSLASNRDHRTVARQPARVAAACRPAVSVGRPASRSRKVSAWSQRLRSGRRREQRRPSSTTSRSRTTTRRHAGRWTTRASRMCARRHRPCCADLDRLAVDRPGRDALEPVDRLLKPIVAVRRRHPRLGRDSALEHRRGPARVSGLDQEADAQRTERNRVVVDGLLHGGLLRAERT
jgi:hypothetical protein